MLKGYRRRIYRCIIRQRIPIAWIVFALISAVLLSVYLWPEPIDLPVYKPTDAQKSGYHPGGSNCDPMLSFFLGPIPKTLSESDRCAKEAEDYRLQTNDLIQQTRSADAAQAQVMLTYKQGVIAVLQTIGGFLTLVAATAAAIYARDAAKHTKLGADQARRSADAARTQLADARRMERPYAIGVNPRMVFKGPTNGKILCSVVFDIKNCGSGPAFVEEFSSEVHESALRGHPTRVSVAMAAPYFVAIMEGEMDTIPDIWGGSNYPTALVEEVFQSQRGHTTFLFSVRYRDVFGVRRETYSGYRGFRNSEGVFSVAPLAVDRYWRDNEVSGPSQFAAHEKHSPSN